MDKDLYYKIENRNKKTFVGIPEPIGVIPYSVYRKAEHIWNTIPNLEQYEVYKLYCYVRGYDAESIHSIKRNAKK